MTVGEAKQYFNKIQNTFEEIGYDVSAKVLDSRYFGVSQTRTRVFFIGIRNDITEKVGLTFLNDDVFSIGARITFVTFYNV